MLRGEAKTGTVPNSHRFSKHGAEILRMYRLAHSTQPAGRLSKTFLRSLGTKKDKKVRLDPNVPSSTITTHPDEFIHCSEPRNVTVREMGRLQSFPDDFHFFGRYTIIDLCISNRHLGHKKGGRSEPVIKERRRSGLLAAFLVSRQSVAMRSSRSSGWPLASSALKCVQTRSSGLSSGA